MNKKRKKLLAAKRKKEWGIDGRYVRGKDGGFYFHPAGYCGNQMCCWGKPGNKVIWA